MHRERMLYTSIALREDGRGVGLCVVAHAGTFLFCFPNAAGVVCLPVSHSTPSLIFYSRSEEGTFARFSNSDKQGNRLF